MDRMFDLCVYLLLAALLLFGIKKNRDMTADAFLQKLNALRGIFAVEIVVGHTIRFEVTWLYPLGKFMIISVAFFFFVSAFGMAYSFKMRGGGSLFERLFARKGAVAPLTGDRYLCVGSIA